MIVLDTSLLYALLDAAEPQHAAARAWYAGCREELATTPLILAELDWMAGRRLGPAAAAAVRADITAGAYRVEWWPGAERAAASIAGRWASIELGLADASLVALAEHVGTTRIATFDERHFRAVRPGGDGAGAFTLLPLDA